MASVRKLPNGQRQVVWSDYVDGVRHQRRRNFASAAEANPHKARMELQELRGVASPRISLREYLRGWLAAKEPEVEPNTAAGYSRIADYVLRDAIAALPLERVTPGALEEFYARLATQPSARGKPLGPVSIRSVASLLATAFRDALRRRTGGIVDNPASIARRPRGQAPRVTAPSAEQVAALLNELRVNNPALVELVTILVATGCRRSEALGLRWQDVDFATGMISFRQVVIQYEGQWSIRSRTKTAAGRRSIRLAAEAVEALRRQQVRVAEARLKLGRYWADHDLVFPDVATGGPRSPVLVTKQITKATKQVERLPCGWPEHASPVHSLRHAAATHALAAGVDLGTVSRRLGHSSTAVTARVYVHGLAEKDEAAGEAMAALLGGAAKRRG